MKIGEAEVVLRYHVIYSVDEVLKLRAAGRFPPNAPETVELWQTAQEIADICKTLGCDVPELLWITDIEPAIGAFIKPRPD